MKTKSWAGWVTLGLISATGVGAGCGASHESGKDQGAPGATATRTNHVALGSPVMSKGQAIAIANQAVLTNGWKEFRELACDLERDRWVVRLQRLPVVWGGDATIEIPTNGEPIRYIRGK
jgi:hypothetical protein